jgi:hypothetical protein
VLEGKVVTIIVDVETDVSVVVMIVVFGASPTAKNRLAEISTPATTIAAAMTR